MAFVSRNDVYRVAGIPSDGSIVSDNDVDMHIEAAESYVERLIGTCLQPGGKAVTETLDGTGTNTLFLPNYPLISLDSLTIDSTSVTTSNVYQWTKTGKLQLKTSAEVTTFKDSYPQLVSVTYTYGEEPDERIKHFAAAIAAMMTLTEQIGGTFDDVTSFQLPEISGSLGEPYTNIREALARLKQFTDQALAQGWIRPKAQFG